MGKENWTSDFQSGIPCIEAIEEYLEQKEKLAKGRAALLRLGKGLGKGPRNLADKHDEYLYGKEFFLNRKL